MNAPVAPRVAVIGAGWAGLTAAVRLVDGGADCTVFEAARQVGGRARRVDWTLPDGRVVALDNGQHILLGAYRETLAMLRRVGVDPGRVLRRQPLAFDSVSGFALRAPRWPAPWHLLAAIVGARGLGWGDRLAMAGFMSRMRLRGWRVGADCSVDALLDAQRQSAPLRQLVWEPLCVAALNTPSRDASARVFLNVLRDSLGATRAASDMLLPATDLGDVFPDAAARHISARGRLRLGARVTGLHADADGITLQADGAAPFDAVVIAVAAHHAGALLRDAGLADLARRCDAIRHQSITTGYLLYPPGTRLRAAMLALDEQAARGDYGQWAFDRGVLGGADGLIAVVISADGPHRDLDHAALSAALHAQLARQAGLTRAPLASRIVIEKRATFACTPNLDRPGVTTPLARVVLAGDYIASDYPATLESAVRAGGAAAAALQRALKLAPTRDGELVFTTH